MLITPLPKCDVPIRLQLKMSSKYSVAGSSQNEGAKLEPATASAFPAACCGASERIKKSRIPYREDSLQLAAGTLQFLILFVHQHR
jgi:hypothetical protein